MTRGSGETHDPLRLLVFHHLFAACAEEMGESLMRAAFSPNIRERRDFSCALFDGAGEAVAQAAHLPVHLGSAPLSLAAVLDDLDLEPLHQVADWEWRDNTEASDVIDAIVGKEIVAVNKVVLDETALMLLIRDSADSINPL